MAVETNLIIRKEDRQGCELSCSKKREIIMIHDGPLERVMERDSHAFVTHTLMEQRLSIEVYLVELIDGRGSGQKVSRAWRFTMMTSSESESESFYGKAALGDAFIYGLMRIQILDDTRAIYARPAVHFTQAQWPMLF